jgi:hypothetical protein
MNLTRHNYEEYFLLYVDNELGTEERGWVEQFTKENPDLEEELRALQSAVLDSEEIFSFGDKGLLYRQEVTGKRAGSLRVIPLWKKVVPAAAAAILLLGVGIFWLREGSRPREVFGPANNPASAGTALSQGTTAQTAPPQASTAQATPSKTNPSQTSTAQTASSQPLSPQSTVITAQTGSKAPAAAIIRRNHQDHLEVKANPVAAASPRFIPSESSHITPSESSGANPASGGNTSPASPNPPTHQEERTVALSSKAPGQLPANTEKPAGENKPVTVTMTHPVSYHTLEDADQKDEGNKILFVRADQVINGGVKGFFRRAGRVLKRSATLNSDNIHPETDSDK